MKLIDYQHIMSNTSKVTSPFNHNLAVTFP